MIKLLARVSDLHKSEFENALRQINHVAAGTGLKQYTTYSRIWEYPWAWFQLEKFKQKSLKLLDIGSELSPFPWFLVSQGFDVTLSDVTADYWPVWKGVGRKLN